MTNAEIIAAYALDNGIDSPLHTYEGWKARGYQVLKGEKARHKISIWKAKRGKAPAVEAADDMEPTTAGRVKMFQTVAAFFEMDQVLPIEIAQNRRARPVYDDTGIEFVGYCMA